ncbi:MAG: BlaI/MecI/CopY family transcriptional regulator [Planctomycetota bacterium]
MTPPRPEPPTDAEWRILKIVFEHGDCAAREVVVAAGKRHGWSASTIKTLLRRLVDKGQLRTRAVGNSLLYRPSLTVHRALQESADALLERSVDGAMGPLLQYLVRKSRLSAGDLDELHKLIEARRAEEERR